MTEAAPLPYKAPHQTSFAQRAAVARLAGQAELVTHRIAGRDSREKPLVLVTVDVLDREKEPTRHNPRPITTIAILLLDWDGHPVRRARMRTDPASGERVWQLHTLARHRAGAKPERTGRERLLPWPRALTARGATIQTVTSWVEKGT